MRTILIFLAVLICSGYAQDEMVRLEATGRVPVLGKTLAFPRIRTHYNLYRNVFQSFNEVPWVDRPLMYDSTLLMLPEAQRKLENDRRQLELACSYGVDGLSMLYHGAIYDGKFLNFIKAAKQTEGRVLLSIIGNVLQQGSKKAAEMFAPVLKSYIESGVAPKFGDKVIVCSYGADYVSTQELAEFLSELKKLCGERFVFISSISRPKGARLNNWVRWGVLFNNNDGSLPKREVEALKEYLRSYLRVSDGILMNNSNHIDTLDNQLDARFYREFIVPLFQQVLAEKEFSGKLLGLSASLGYINNITGGTQLENGTACLRESMQIALDAGADIIVMPEWNELSENTCLEPTVVRSFSSRRLMQYYLENDSNIAAEDKTLPNLIVSQRALVKLGDDFFVELLNIADNDRPYQLTCNLLDESGRVIKSESVNFTGKGLEERRVALGYEQLQGLKAIRVELVIAEPGKAARRITGLPVTTVRTTWNDDFITAKQPLRDLANLSKFTCSVREQDGRNVFGVQAQAQDDKIRAVDIVSGDTVVYSYGGAAEQADKARIHLSFNSLRQVKPFSMLVSAEGGKISDFTDRLQIGSKREDGWQVVGDQHFFEFKANFNRRGAIFSVSNPESAVLKIKTPLFEQEFKVSDILEQGLIVKNYQKTIQLKLESNTRAQKVPKPLDVSSLSFSTPVAAYEEGKVCYVRLLTMSGKTFIKGPFVRSGSGETVEVDVFAARNMTPVRLKADKSACPVLDYKFTPSENEVLKSGYGARWDGTFGGGYALGGAFNNPKRYPAAQDKVAPAWIKEDGLDCLSFNGKGNYLHFPAGVIPARSGFRLEMEIKPTSLKDQYLIRSNIKYEGNFELKISGGKLVCIYRGRIAKGEQPYYNTFTMSAEGLKAGEWNKITASYDLRKIRLQVNDLPVVRKDYSRPGWMLFSPFSFGGWGGDSNQYYEGLLRRFRVSHIAE